MHLLRQNSWSQKFFFSHSVTCPQHDETTAIVHAIWVARTFDCISKTPSCTHCTAYKLYDGYAEDVSINLDSTVFEPHPPPPSVYISNLTSCQVHQSQLKVLRPCKCNDLYRGDATWRHHIFS